MLSLACFLSLSFLSLTHFIDMIQVSDVVWCKDYPIDDPLPRILQESWGIGHLVIILLILLYILIWLIISCCCVISSEIWAVFVRERLPIRSDAIIILLHFLLRIARFRSDWTHRHCLMPIDLVLRIDQYSIFANPWRVLSWPLILQHILLHEDQIRSKAWIALLLVVYTFTTIYLNVIIAFALWCELLF